MYVYLDRNQKTRLLISIQLRFPEISLALKRQNCQVITYPSAFTVPTGRAHWDVLLRARGIESQSYVIAAAQVGAHNSKRISYGHSMIISPWGEVLAQLGGNFTEPEIATAEIDLDVVARVRREMPLNRRTYVYICSYTQGSKYSQYVGTSIPRCKSCVRLLDTKRERFCFLASTGS